MAEKTDKTYKTYKITFKPAEPYFFGNEKNFIFPGQSVKSAYSSSYFIKSEDIPSQTTILGALRYIFLAHKKADFSYTPTQKAENIKAVGENSFDIDSTKKQSFGVIKSISPVFIYGKNKNGEQVTLIPTPMDHKKTKSEEKNENTDEKPISYSPFAEYIPINTTENKKLYANDFDVKLGLENSYMSVFDGEIYSKKDLFKTDLRIGINRSSDKDGFFKKEYKMLKNDFSFAVYADLYIDDYYSIVKENGIDISKPQYVFLGQGKSAFSVTFVEESDSLKLSAENILKKYTRTQYKFIYCLSDSFIASFDDREVLFCAVASKDYRAYKTVCKGKVEKGTELYRLLKAGSIIITDAAADWVNANTNEKANNIGFNTFVEIGG